MLTMNNFTPRLYQETILHTCTKSNCLVVLPTGMGKTGVAMLLAAHRVNTHPDSKILVVAPTKPLVEQHLNTFKKHLTIENIENPDDKFVLFTGAVKPETRQQLFKSAQFIFSTPQGLENDIISNRINLEDISLLVIDECHRAVGDYAYVFLAKQYNKLAKRPKLLALTASPGSDLEKITEVCKNLYIDAIEIRTDKDLDVKPYIQKVNTKWVKVTLPQSFIEIKTLLEECIKGKIDEVKQYGLQPKTQYLTKRELLGMQAALHGRIAKGDHEIETLKSISLLAEAVKVHHALELLETQGISPLLKYFRKIFSDARKCATKAVQNLVKDNFFKSAFFKTEELAEQNMEHPKLEELRNIVEEEILKNNKAKIILFTQYRDSAVRIKEELEKIENCIPEIFVGQAKRGTTGLTQKKQIELIGQFKDGLFNILIATSVAEEGLDIPAVGLVIFYEPIPSAIRTIQRRGRTGRQESGRVIMMMAKGTRDEGYHWSAKHKERRMYGVLEKMRTLLNKSILVEKQKKAQSTLTDFPENKSNENQKIRIFADYREKGSGVIKELIDKDAEIKLEMLGSADFILSNRCAVEFKTTDDFVGSIVDGRLLIQLKELKSNFERPIIIVEGDADIYALRSIHPNAIRGMLATVAVSYGVPILFTRDYKETAETLHIIAKREQEETSSNFAVHFNRKPRELKGQQEYLVSALPSVGAGLAKQLLEHFGSVKKILNASEEELKKVEKIGDKKANAIKHLIDSDYEKW